MRRQIITQMHKFLLSLCLAALTLGVAGARNSGATGDPIPIIIIQENDDLDNNSRGPVGGPISGYVDPDFEVVVLSFTQSCGTVQISFSNQTDGNYYSTSVNGSGTVVIPLSITSGYWTVTFTLSSGAVYLGQFTI